MQKVLWPLGTLGLGPSTKSYMSQEFPALNSGGVFMVSPGILSGLAPQLGAPFPLICYISMACILTRFFSTHLFFLLARL